MIEYFFTLFILKHFICDFPLQFPYMYQNKGKYLHCGGLLHAFVHFLGTYTIINLFTYTLVGHCLWLIAYPLAIIDLVAHYHIDWAKTKINKKTGWTAYNSEYFWWLLGVDQMLHYLTYVGIIWLLLNM